MKLQEAIANIKLPDAEAMQSAAARIDKLTKPKGSLGVLEDIAVRLAGIQRRAHPVIGDKRVVVCVGDHGIVQEKVSAFSTDTTKLMVINFLKGGAGINVLSRTVGANVVVADIGMAADFSHPGLINLKIKKGTDNFIYGPAMSREEAVAAVEAGILLAEKQIKEGATLLAAGDMGIGNTTACSAVLAALTGVDPKEITGRGSGIDERALAKKIALITKALTVNKPNAADGLDVLAKVGGLEIGAMAGLFIGGAALGVPVVIDGFIAATAALLADKIAPLCRHYMFASHLSAEPGHQKIMEILKLTPVLQLNMRLGEGTGAVLAFPLLEAAANILNEMATFEELTN